MLQLRPTKKIIPIVAACILAVGAVAVAAEYSGYSNYSDVLGRWNDTNTQKTGEPVVATGVMGDTLNKLATNALKEISSLDEDGDGLKNWEEALWKTDPKKPDTDGDGTTDSDEIKASRDPNKKGPNDTMTKGYAGSSLAVSGSGALIPEEDLTETEKISRELFAKYLEAKRNGSAVEEDFVQDILSRQEPAAQVKKFAKKDIVLVPQQGSEAEALKRYGNAFGLILASYPTQSKESELDIVLRAVEKNSTTEIAKLDPIISGYQGIIRDLAKVPVSENMVPIHLSVLNSLQAVLEDTQGFRKIFSDPIVGMTSMQKYISDIVILRNTIFSLGELFARNGVTFTQEEYGYVLMRSI